MTAAYSDELVTLHHGDCAEVLPSIGGGCADLAIVDPPYGDTALEWDKLTTDWLPIVADVLKPNGTIWLWGSLRSLLAMVPRAIDAGWAVSQDVVWEKHNGSGSSNDRFRRVHEQAVLLYRGPWAAVYADPQFSADATARTVRRRQRPTHWSKIGGASYTSEVGGPRLMRSVMYERSAHGGAIHPTQKPAGVTQTLIQYACPPGGLVVSPYAGSGTDLEAARACGRRAIGVERDPQYLADAVARLAHAPLDFTAQG